MTRALSSETIHATCVAIGDHAVLIEGPPGAGKSDLALRLIDRGARLVSDDYTTLMRQDGALIARAPDTIAGKIEVRGIGIVEMPHRDDVPVALIVVIVAAPPRLPGSGRKRAIAGVTIREVALPALEPSAPVKVELALKLRLASAA